MIEARCGLLLGYKKTGQKCPKLVHLLYELQTLDESTGSGGVFGNLSKRSAGGTSVQEPFRWQQVRLEALDPAARGRSRFIGFLLAHHEKLTER